MFDILQWLVSSEQGVFHKVLSTAQVKTSTWARLGASAKGACISYMYISYFQKAFKVAKTHFRLFNPISMVFLDIIRFIWIYPE